MMNASKKEKRKRSKEGERERGGKRKRSFFTEYENEHTIVRI
jgi:hypothetical protein